MAMHSRPPYTVYRYRTVAMEPDEVIVGVFLPHATKPDPFEFVRPFKQARRREDDISIVTAGGVSRSFFVGDGFIRWQP